MMKTLVFMALLLGWSMGLTIFSYGTTTRKASISLKQGDAYELHLESNPTTNSRWKLEAHPAHSDVLSPDMFGQFVVNPQTQGLDGAGGKQVFRFEAKTVGPDTLAFSYFNPMNPRAAIQLEVDVSISS